jgi:polyphosphate kinase
MSKHKRGRLTCVAHLLRLIPYEEVPREKIKLPKRQARGDYIEPDYPFRQIPAKY